MTGWRDEAAGNGGWFYEMRTSDMVDFMQIKIQKDL